MELMMAGVWPYSADMSPPSTLNSCNPSTLGWMIVPPRFVSVMLAPSRYQPINTGGCRSHLHSQYLRGYWFPRLGDLPRLGHKRLLGSAVSIARLHVHLMASMRRLLCRQPDPPMNCL